MCDYVSSIVKVNSIKILTVLRDNTLHLVRVLLGSEEFEW